MKVIVFGKTGQLARSLADHKVDAIKATFLARSECDLSDPTMIRSVLNTEKPDFVINAAAYTDVDQAEQEPEIANYINAIAPRLMAQWAAEHAAKLIHISTDFVFDGTGESPYKPEDKATPACIYGKSKLKGEFEVMELAPKAAMIIRTAWVYSEYGNNFVTTMLRLMREHDSLSVVDDQRGSPTYAASLARTIMQIISEGRFDPGIYHWTDRSNATWYEFAREIQQEALKAGLLKRTIPINKISTDQYPTRAARPAYSVLDTTDLKNLLGRENVDWQINLRLALLRIANQI